MSGWRTPDWGRVDRSRPVRFSFDGRVFSGFAGDTVASALLANGVDVVTRSVRFGRPRGIVAVGSAEPNALISLEPTGDPARATEVEIAEGLRVRSVSGRHPVPQPDDLPGEHIWRHCDVLYVGSGRAAVADALAVARAGKRVLMIDGGTGLLATGRPDAADVRALRDNPEVLLLPRTLAIGRYDGNLVLAAERRRSVPGNGPDVRDRLWHIRAREVVLATGTIERPLVFADNDRPGVMLAGAVGVYLWQFGVASGQRAVVFTTNHSAYPVALDLHAAGVEVAAIVDARAEGAAANPFLAKATAAGIEVLHGHQVIGTTGEDRLTEVTVAPRAGDGAPRTFPVDLLAVSGGWDPAIRLAAHRGARLGYDAGSATFVAAEPQEDLRIIGSAADPLLATGPAPEPLWLIPAADERLDRHFVDLQRDATAADIRTALDAGMRSPEHIKRFTTIGTGNDQGRTSAVNEVGVIAELLDEPIETLGPTTFRPPVAPTAFGLFGGSYRGELFDPIRTTPIHESHVAAGALFENVGQWKRAWAYPTAGESFDEAVARECRAVRYGVGIMDVSTLGKIDIQGPDAAAFLDRIYTNTFSTLKVGAARYGLMLRSDGMVMDDGTTTRLADDHFFMTTTTGGAAGVLDWLEEWLQTEWTDLRVRCTTVTDQWAAVAIAGPRSRELLARLAPDLNVEAGAFPFMTVRPAQVAGIPARVFRISFSGELAYEVNVRSWYGRSLWDAIVAAGADIDVTPYGTEAMHVLRAEKGYVIVGQESDGTATASDLGLDWMVSSKKWFVGRQALDRPALRRSDRRQLVGLLPVDERLHIPEGSPIVLGGGAGGGLGTSGHVSSSYWSPVLGRQFGLGLLAGGRARIGSTVTTLINGRTIELQVVEPVFWDPKNERRDG